MHNTAVVITTYNEADTIESLVSSLIAEGYPVIVSDGGSNDGTLDIALAAGADVMKSDGRLPIAEALMIGFCYALDCGYTRIAVMDAGGSHHVGDLPVLLSTEADVVIGSRFVKGASYHGRFWRALMSRFAALLCNFAQPGANFKDWTSGYRVYSKTAVDVILNNDYQTDMHTWQIETLARLSEAGLSIKEVPITYTAGRSSFNFRTVSDALTVWLHLMHHIGWRGSRMVTE